VTFKCTAILANHINVDVRRFIKIQSDSILLSVFPWAIIFKPEEIK
jgi:hypothetical protein